MQLAPPRCRTPCRQCCFSRCWRVVCRPTPSPPRRRVHLMRAEAADGGLARRQTCRVLVLDSAVVPLGQARDGHPQCCVSVDGLAVAALLLRSTCAGTSGRSRRSPSRLQRPQRFQRPIMHLQHGWADSFASITGQSSARCQLCRCAQRCKPHRASRVRRVQHLPVIANCGFSTGSLFHIVCRFSWPHCCDLAATVVTVSRPPQRANPISRCDSPGWCHT